MAEPGAGLSLVVVGGKGVKRFGRAQALPFLRALMGLVTSGIQVADGVKLLGKRLSDPTLRALAASLWDQLSQGRSLSQAMTAHGAVFAGDTFGVSYRAFDHEGHPFVIPTTTPVQFDPDALHASIDRILALEPRAVYITHYGERLGVPRLGAERKSRLDEMVGLARRVAGAHDRGIKLREGLHAMLLRWLDAHGWRGTPELVQDWWQTDIDLNAQGLEVWLDRQH